MIAALDVDYRPSSAVAACVLFRGWTAQAPLSERVVTLGAPAPYEPGQFYRRELPCLLKALEQCENRPDVVVIDGYVWLGDENVPGLGGHLYQALTKQVIVVGVAKTRFANATAAVSICRGASRAPLYVTAAGMPAVEAARLVQGMHGPFRIPTLLKRADQLCRQRDSGLPGGAP